MKTNSSGLAGSRTAVPSMAQGPQPQHQSGGKQQPPWGRHQNVKPSTILKESASTFTKVAPTDPHEDSMHGSRMNVKDGMHTVYLKVPLGGGGRALCR